MSFGFSVGDIIAVASLANKIRQRLFDSPEQFKAIATEVRSLSIVLQDADIAVSERELIGQQKTELDGIRSWIRTPKSQAGGLESQAIFAVKDGINRLNLGQQEQEQKEERQIIIDWVSAINYASQHSDFVTRRQEGTGQWLLDSNEFQHWLNHGQQILFCPGMPGAGKTMVASIVIDHLYAKYQTDSSVGIAYLYCNFRRQDEQKPVDLLASLLKRLLEGRPNLPISMKDLYEQHKSKQTRPSFGEISTELRSIIASFSTTFIVIDALDECQVSDGGLTKFLSEILRLQTNIGANLFVTSRFIPHIVEEFQGAPSLEIRASDGDVKRYLDGQSSRLPSFVRRNLDMQEKINAEIVKAVDGMFLLAQLHLESLIGKRSPKAIRSALEKLPTGSEAYDYAYKEAMERIEGQIADSQDLAKQALGWITCSKRPLTTLELQHALAVEIGQSSLDEENLPDIEDVVSVCAGLVTIDEESGIIRLVHYTTQEYFDRNWTSWFPNAEKDIAKTCVTYQLFSTFRGGSCAHNELKERLRLNPLYDYATRNWAYYASSESTEVEELILDFLQNDAAVCASDQAAVVPWDDYPDYDIWLPRGMRGTHLAAYFGLEKVMRNLLRKGHHPDSKDSFDYTPLLWAASKGHDEVVKLLLATPGVNADYHTNLYQTPLSLAAYCGHESVVKLLLATPGVNADSMQYGSNTPLCLAAERGNEEVVKLLLATTGIDVNSRDRGGMTPLFLAAQNGHEEVVKLLLAMPGVYVDSNDSYGETPLWMAAQNGHEEVVKLLLATPGVDVDYKNAHGKTPLWMAASRGHVEVVKLLLSTPGVNVDSEDIDGRSPLSMAALCGRDVQLVKLLKSGGAMTD
ncbi:hypothetical protein V499_04810 [Pseudogymnoascus sp. VKM F-103]|nr:hypothetical protein V499_04810 [Pseudogymnoascus sp. VKM F-103]